MYRKSHHKSHHDSDDDSDDSNSSNDSDYKVLKKIEDRVHDKNKKIEDRAHDAKNKNDPHTSIKCKKNNQLMCTDPNKIYRITMNTEKTILITATGRGGAGGIGYVIGHYYYSGGGGGASACIVQQPVHIPKGTIIGVQVGRGGCSKHDTHATDSIITIKYPHIMLSAKAN